MKPKKPKSKSKNLHNSKNLHISKNLPKSKISKNKNSKIVCIAAVAMTIDGKIARYSGHASNWTSKEDKRHLHKIEDSCDVMVVGRKSYKLAQKPLSKRNVVVFTRSVETTQKESERLVLLNPQNVDFVKFAAEKNYSRACVLGGPEIYSYFLEHNLLDELYITVEPLVFGEGLGLFNRPVETKNFKLKSVKKLNKCGTLLQHYVKS